MNNLHFYIQCLMLLLALSIAVQIPFDGWLVIYVLLIELILAVYQMVMSSMLIAKLSKPSTLLKIHFYGTWAYLFGLVIIGVVSPSWIDNIHWHWQVGLLGIPWVIIIFFLVVIDDLESIRNYRL